ncbi:MAG TPA: D-alanyl-D-alanine carboxypeptidase [Candidatus Wildermuthbacteria bacterium]|nr:D-alanyl-D-alanine carboxypeptidase [Candidatus Wildermuthbacteria bacterium]
MNQNTKVFLFALMFSLPFFVGLNFLAEEVEEIAFWREIANNPEILAAQTIQQQLEEAVHAERPILLSSTPKPELYVRSALSMNVSESGSAKILFTQQPDKPLAIASLSKLMTALVALKQYPINREIYITKEIVDTEESFGELRVGDMLTVQDLLYPLLMESSNDAAAALTSVVGEVAFVDLMNLEAKNLGLFNTLFIDASGLDPDPPETSLNLSTSRDLAKLTQHIVETYPQIFDILGLQQFRLYDARGKFHHTLTNTNQLLENNGWPTKVMGGKTGWTPEAKGALILVLESPKDKGYIINVVLGSSDRFEDMREMVQWVYTSFRW